MSGTHFVDEGNVGIYYNLGSLSNTTTQSGIQFKYPFPIAKFSVVNIRPQTDQIIGVSCGTSDGLTLIFENVDVGNTLLINDVIRTIRKYGEDYDKYLVKDKVRHQMAVICANLTSHEVFNTKFYEIDDLLQTFLIEVNKELDSGLIIDFVRLSKPMIPEAIRKNYERIAEEKTNLKVEYEKQERLKKEAETKQILHQKELALSLHKSQMEFQIASEKSKMEFQIAAEKSKNENEIKMQKILSEQEHNLIENEIKKAQAITKQIGMIAEANGLKELYTIIGYKEYMIAQELAHAMGPNAKFFFGEKVPNFLPVSMFQTTKEEL